MNKTRMRHGIRLLLSIILLIIHSATANLARASEDRSAIKAVDVYVVSGTSFVPGSLASLRIITMGVTGIQSSQPIPFAGVSITINDGKRNQLFYSGASDLLGLTLAQFRVPDWPNGMYRMDVQAKSAFGTGTVSHTVTLERSGRIHLMVDQQIVKPGQRIEYRALALDAADLKPLSHQPIRFEITNPSGDLTSQKWVQANLFGIASDQYHLADLAEPGVYRIHAYLETSQPVVSANTSVLVATSSPSKGSADNTGPATKKTLNIMAFSEGVRLVAGLNNRVLIETYDFEYQPKQTTVTIKHQNKLLSRVMTGPDGIAVASIQPRLAWLENQNPAPIENSTDNGFTSSNYVHGRNAPRCLNLEIEARDMKGLQGQITHCFQMQPAVDRILIETDKTIYENGSLVRGAIAATMDTRVCHLDLMKNQQTLLSRSVLLQQQRGTFDFRLPPHMAGLLELHVYFILDNGNLISDVRSIYVQPMRSLKIEITRDRSVYRPGQMGRIQLSIRDFQNNPIQAALGISSYEATSDRFDRVPYQLQYALKYMNATKAKTVQSSDQKRRDDVDFVLQQMHNQYATRILLQQIPSAARLSIWSNPVWVRTNKAIQDRRNILQALYLLAQTQPLGTKAHGGKWKYRNDILKEILGNNLLSRSNLTDPLGQPYTMEKLTTLWPDMDANSFLAAEEIKRLWNLRYVAYSQFNERTRANTRNAHDLATVAQESFRYAMSTQRVSRHDATGKPYKWEELKDLPGFRLYDWIEQQHVYRAQIIYRALSRYGKSNQRWFRLSVLDKKHNTYNLSNDVIQRATVRGYLDKHDSRDVWSRPFKLKKLDQPRQQGVLDHRLRYYQIYSMGQDGLDNTDDDLAYSSFTDGGFTDLLKAIGSSPEDLDTLTDRITTIKARHSTGKQRVTSDTQTLYTTHATDLNHPVYDRLVFVPALITDEKGQAHLEFRLPPKKTTWRLKIWANSMRGGMGFASHEIKVF